MVIESPSTRIKNFEENLDKILLMKGGDRNSSSRRSKKSQQSANDSSKVLKSLPKARSIHEMLADHNKKVKENKEVNKI